MFFSRFPWFAFLLGGQTHLLIGWWLVETLWSWRTFPGDCGV